MKLFQQDNARAHTANVSKAFLSDQSFETLDWPARSPDLSPIEHFWDELGRRIRKQPGINSIAALRRMLIEQYHSIPQEFIANLIHSMPRRIRECREARGGHTRY